VSSPNGSFVSYQDHGASASGSQSFQLKRRRKLRHRDAARLPKWRRAHGTPPATQHELLVSAIEAIIEAIIEAGYRPENKEHGYVLRKLLRQLCRLGGSMTHPFFQAEVARQEKLRDRYQKLLPIHGDKSPECWFDTHGIEVRDMPAGACTSNDPV
jgi:hypothetical protein